MGHRDDVLKQSLDMVDVGYGVFDPEDRLIYCNRAFGTLRSYPSRLCEHGTSLADLLTHSAQRGDFGPGDQVSLVQERLDEIKTATDREVMHVRPDGQILQVRYQRKDDGGLVVTYQDRTAEKSAEAALRRSEERYALVSEAAEEAIYEWDINAGEFISSPRLDNLLEHAISGDGKPMETWGDLVHAEDRERYRSAIRSHFTGRTSAVDETYRVRARGGGFRWVHDRAVGVRGADDRVVRLVGAVRDITEERAAAAELETTRARLLLSLSSISDGILLTNADNQIEMFNDRYVELFQESSGEVDMREIIYEGRPFVDVVRDTYELGVFRPHPDGVNAFIANRLKAWETDASEWELQLANGVWLQLKERKMPDGSRISVYADITDLKRREDEARAARERLISSLSNLSDGILIVDSERCVELFNPRYVQIFSDACGQDAAPIVRTGRPFFEMLREGYGMGMFKPFPGGVEAWLTSRITAWDKPASQLQIELANGGWILLNDREMPDGGRISIYTDITDLKRREAETEAARQRFEEAIEAISSGFALWDEEDRLVISNTRYTTYFSDLSDMILPGNRFEDIIRSGLERGMFPLADGNVEEYLDGIAAKRSAAQGETREQFINGFWLQVTDHRTRDGGIVSIYTDISELKKREKDTVRARDAAEAALADLQQAQERLVQSEKMASLGQLTAGIAHEIKNPLNFVNNFAKLSAEMLEELEEILESPFKQLDDDDRDDAEDLFETVRENLVKIAEHGQRADSIVKNMLLHSRDGPSERQTANLNALAEEALNLAYHGARAEDKSFNIDIRKEIDPQVGDVDCYPQDLMRVFLNLMTNAMYAANKRSETAPNGFSPEITLTTRVAGGSIEVEIRDNGIGIPEDVKEQIFLPFFTTKPAGEGTGLGLSLSYDIIVKQHGGTLTVDSAPDQFTLFTVSIPRKAALP